MGRPFVLFSYVAWYWKTKLLIMRLNVLFALWNDDGVIQIPIRWQILLFFHFMWNACLFLVWNFPPECWPHEVAIVRFRLAWNYKTKLLILRLKVLFNYKVFHLIFYALEKKPFPDSDVKDADQSIRVSILIFLPYQLTNSGFTISLDSR